MAAAITVDAWLIWDRLDNSSRVRRLKQTLDRPMTAPISADTLQATRAFAARVALTYPTRQAFLFGSRARGELGSDSD